MSKNKRSLSEQILNLPKSIWLAIFFVFLILVFGFFDYSFVRCTIGQFECQSIEGALVSQYSNSAFNLMEANKTLGNVNSDINAKTTSVNQKEKEIGNLQNTINNIERESVSANLIGNANLVNNLNSNKLALTRSLTVSNTEQVLLTAEKTKAEAKLLETRKNISSRYSSRLLWTLLTAVFFVLCSIAVITSIYILQKSLRNIVNTSALDWTAIKKEFVENKAYYWVNIIIFFIILLALYFGINYMSVFAPIFDLSIFKYGDLSPFSINLFNGIGVSAVIYVIAASCSILYKVEKIKTGWEKPPEQAKKELDKLELKEQNLMSQTAIAPIAKVKTALASVTAEKTPLEQQLEEYAEPRKHLRWLLYIGGAMLFVGLVRINVLTTWHLYFVSSGYDKLFTEFSNSALSVQAFFYTILLALIYFPVSYSFPDTPDATNVQETLQKKGFFATVNEFLPRLLAFVLPLLASQLAELVKLFTNITP